MAWNGFTKVLDFKGTLESRSEESSKWSNKGSKRGKDESMKLHWRDVECIVLVPSRNHIGMG